MQIELLRANCPTDSADVRCYSARETASRVNWNKDGLVLYVVHRLYHGHVAVGRQLKALF